MNIAVIFAGGTGHRMNTRSKPKQFLEMHGKPVIIYTLENFQKHKEISKIIIVCLGSWIEYCKKIVNYYGLDKVASIIPGGMNGQESIFNGLIAAKEIAVDDDIVLIHDGVRPLINKDIISKCIQCVNDNGNAITVSQVVETVFRKTEDGLVGDIFKRSECELAKAPQCFYLKDIYQAHMKAKTDGINDFIDSASLMKYYGHQLYSVEGPFENIKITTPVDFYIFRAIVEAKENLQIMGL